MKTKKDPTEKSKLEQELAAKLDDATLLARMKALGFWPDVPIPPDPPQEVTERRELGAEIAKLARAALGAKDPDAALALERKRRWEESKKRRSIKRAQRESEAKERAAAWAQKRAALLLHAGEGVSSGLSAGKPMDRAKLEARGLPIVEDAPALAAAMGISLGRLRFLTFHRRGTTLVHYHRYGIPKKDGGVRPISAPKPDLARAQEWVLSAILAKLSVPPTAHGFVPGRSTVTNAAPHQRHGVVVNLDLRDFFPSIGFRRVKGLFVALGYGEDVATTLALLTTEPPRVPAELDGVRYWVALSERVLPQGACTSPAITNAICRRLDARITGLARKLGFSTTRYADDLTFSGNDRRKVGRLLRSVRTILASEGFSEREDKTRVMGPGASQKVTGIVVNAGLHLPRAEKRALRAILHNVAKTGLAAQNREGHPRFADYLRGRVAYALMIEPDLALKLRSALERALGSGH